MRRTTTNEATDRRKKKLNPSLVKKKYFTNFKLLVFTNLYNSLQVQVCLMLLKRCYRACDFFFGGFLEDHVIFLVVFPVTRVFFFVVTEFS